MSLHGGRLSPHTYCSVWPAVAGRDSSAAQCTATPCLLPAAARSRARAPARSHAGSAPHFKLQTFLWEYIVSKNEPFRKLNPDIQATVTYHINFGHILYLFRKFY